MYWLFFLIIALNFSGSISNKLHVNHFDFRLVWLFVQDSDKGGLPYMTKPALWFW